MLLLEIIRNNRSYVVEALKKRNYSDEQLGILDDIIRLDDARKVAQDQRDTSLSAVNQLSKEIGQLMKTGQAQQAESLKQEVARLKESIEVISAQHDRTVQDIEAYLITLPNTPHSSVPAGQHAEHNEVYQAWDKVLPSLPPSAKPHWELGEIYNLVHFPLGVKITGSGFPVYRGKGAQLQRALVRFFLDEAHAAGYEEIAPPFLVNAESARGTGQLPDKEGQMYHCEKDGLYLIPTSEVPVTNIYRDELLDESTLPIKMCAYSPCFRREAGAYGKDVRGLNRVHQFEKVEIVRIEHPDRSYDALKEMLTHVSGLLDKLELPYRILRLCGGDMSFSSALTYDFEVYAAAQGRWLEVSSVSNFETFQTNRMKLRFRNAQKQTRLCHTLNGSALALARIYASILENHQTENGIRIPKALAAYTGWDMIE